MKDLLLYLQGSDIKACLIQEGSTELVFQNEIYFLECDNFGEWVPLESEEGKTRGFLLIPIELIYWPDNYIQTRILNTDLVKHGNNIQVTQEDEYVYIRIWLNRLSQSEELTEGPQALYIQVFHSQKEDIIFCLRCFHEEDIAKIGFALETWNTPTYQDEQPRS